MTLASRTWRVAVLISHGHPKYCAANALVTVSGIDSDGAEFTQDCAFEYTSWFVRDVRANTIEAAIKEVCDTMPGGFTYMSVKLAFAFQPFGPSEGFLEAQALLTEAKLAKVAQ